jgi:hypothetical protein
VGRVLPPEDPRAPLKGRGQTDLLQFRPVRWLLLGPVFPYVFQAVTLALFLVLAVTGWGLFAPYGVGEGLYARSNVVNLVVWGLWWPAMIWITVLFGRVWCAVCPLELVGNGVERLARSLGVRQRKLGGGLRGGGAMVAFYVLVLMSIAAFHLHYVPAYTSAFLWILLGGAVAVSFYYRDRAFCRAFCPVGVLLATYGARGVFAVRAASRQQCRTCVAKGCVRAHRRYRLDGRSCPSLLHPGRLNDNTECLFCGQCLKSCGPANLQLLVRRPFHPADRREPLASWPVTLFVMVASGFVTCALSSGWRSAQLLLMWPPMRLAEALEFYAWSGWFRAVWGLLLFPPLLWSALGGVTVLLRGASSVTDAWRRMALPFSAVIAAGHMVKALAEFSAWVVYLPQVAQTPLGRQSSVAIQAGLVRSPEPLLVTPIISAAGAGLLLVGAWMFWRESRLADEVAYRQRLAPLLVAAAYLLLVLGWSFVEPAWM